jgi:hypothetical protein
MSRVKRVQIALNRKKERKISHRPDKNDWDELEMTGLSWEIEWTRQ